MCGWIVVVMSDEEGFWFEQLCFVVMTMDNDVTSKISDALQSTIILKKKHTIHQHSHML